MGQVNSTWPNDRESPTPRGARARFSRQFEYYDGQSRQNDDEQAVADDDVAPDYGEDGEDDCEAHRDVHGRRHVDIESQNDRMFVLNTHPSSTFVQFTPEGDKADSAFRAYLGAYIPKQMFRDEYGDIRPLGEISPDQVATFQAKLWRELPRNVAAISPLGTSDITKDDRLAADAIEQIANTLELNHVFVLRKRPAGQLLCSYELCSTLHSAKNVAHTPDVVSLEPVVTFATLDSASALNLFDGKIFVFRRISKKYSQYGIQVEQMIPEFRLAFCVECLQYLWDWRVHAWLIKERYKGSYECPRDTPQGFEGRSKLSSSPSVSQRSPNSTTALNFSTKIADQEYGEEGRSSWDDIVEDENVSPEPASESEVDTAGRAFQLDGTSDQRPVDRRESTSHSENTRQPLDVIESQPGSNTSPRSLRALRRNSLLSQRVNNARPPAFAIYSPPQWIAINAHPQTRMTPTSTLIQLPTTKSAMSEEIFDILNSRMGPTEGQPFLGTFSTSAAEQYKGARAGVPVGEPVEYQYKKGISSPAPPIADLGPILPEEPRTSRPRTKEGGILGTEIVSSAVRASGVQLTSRSTPKKNASSTGLIHIDPELESQPQVTSDASIPPKPSSAAAKANGLLTWMAMAKKAVSVPIDQDNVLLKPSNNSLKLVNEDNRNRAADGVDKNSPLGSGHDVNAQNPPAEQQPVKVLSSTKPVKKHLTLGVPEKSAPSRPQPLDDEELYAMFKSDKGIVPVARSKPVISTPTTTTPLRCVPTEPETHVTTPAGSRQKEKKSAKHKIPVPSHPVSDAPKLPSLPILCSCRKPSLNPTERIVRCANADCIIKEYHYRCLDKSQKLATRGANWVCAACKAAAIFTTEAAKQPKTNVGFSFTKKDVDDAFAFPRQHGPSNPYGIGLKFGGYNVRAYGVVGHAKGGREERKIYGVNPNAKATSAELLSDVEDEDADGEENGEQKEQEMEIVEPLREPPKNNNRRARRDPSGGEPTEIFALSPKRVSPPQDNPDGADAVSIQGRQWGTVKVIEYLKAMDPDVMEE